MEPWEPGNDLNALLSVSDWWPTIMLVLYCYGEIAVNVGVTVCEE